MGKIQAPGLFKRTLQALIPIPLPQCWKIIFLPRMSVYELFVYELFVYLAVCLPNRGTVFVYELFVYELFT